MKPRISKPIERYGDPGDSFFWPRFVTIVIVSVVLGLMLTGCATPPPLSAVCPVVAQLPQQTQARIADEAEALPSGAYLRELVLPDWIRMRDEARAICGLERMRADDD